MSKTVEDRLDHILDKVHNIDKILERNTNSLELHMKRTDLLEKKLKPVEDHVSRVDGAFRLLGVISILTGVFATLWKLFVT